MLSAVSAVEVESSPDGSSIITWRLDGPPVPVDVAIGASPHDEHHRYYITVPAGQTELRVVPESGGRLFVSIAPHGSPVKVVGAQRRLAFEGATNFRDLGGYRTTDGRTTRWGRVFRSDALHNLSIRDLALFEHLGVKTVFDLRGDLEREERPNLVTSRPLTILSRAPDAPSSVGSSGSTMADGEQILYNLYLGVLEHSAACIGELFVTMGSSDGLPAVFHCHAGKDRTGTVAALLLEALGVDRETILDDYELTARYRLRAHQESSYQRLIESGLPPEAAAGVLTAPRWAMKRALEEFDIRYGSVDDYLCGPAGMRPEDVTQLRDQLLG